MLPAVLVETPTCTAPTPPPPPAAPPRARAACWYSLWRLLRGLRAERSDHAVQLLKPAGWRAGLALKEGNTRCLAPCALRLHVPPHPVPPRARVLTLPPPSVPRAARSPPEANHGTSIERVRVEVPDVPEGLTVYVTAYLPQADKGRKRGELKLAVEAFDGVAVGKPPRYGKGGVEFINFPFGSFGSEPGFEQWWPTTAQSIFQIFWSQTGSL